MAFVSGYLDVGTAIVSGALVPPPSGYGYAAQPILFNSVSGGIILSSNGATFGPVGSGGGPNPWGTLTVFQVSDTAHTPAWLGTLITPITPVSGAVVQAPIGDIAITLNQQLALSDMASGLLALNIWMPYAGGNFTGNVGFTSGTVAAAGSTSGNAAALPYQYNNVTSDDPTKGVHLAASGVQWVRNEGPSGCMLYPTAGATLAGASGVNIPLPLGVSGVVQVANGVPTCVTY